MTREASLFITIPSEYEPEECFKWTLCVPDSSGVVSRYAIHSCRALWSERAAKADARKIAKELGLIISSIAIHQD